MPLTVPDQTLAAQIKVPDTLNTLSSIMNFKNQQQQLKSSQLDYQKRDAELAKTIQLRDLAASPDMQNPDGTINRDKFANEAFKVDPTQGAAAAQGGLTNQSSQIANDTSKFALHKDYTGTMLQTATGLLQDPRITADPQNYNPEQANKALTEAFQQARAKGVPEDQALLAVAPFVNAIHQPGAVARMLQNTLKGQLGAQGQAGVIQPTMVSNGQQQVNVNPLAVQPPIQQQLPPTTPTFNPDTNAPGYLGPQPEPSNSPQGAQGLDLSKLTPMQQQFLMKKDPAAFTAGVQDFQQTQGKPQTQRSIQSGAPLGVSQAIGGTVDQINKHWSDTQTSASTAQQDIGVLQNIKQHAAGAATGVGADRQALAAGIAGLIGISPGELVKTNSDLLAKNANMLALAGGDTNLARTMAEAATPNSHMTKEAITQAADQVIAQRKLSLARAQFLTPFKAMADQGHPEMYNNALNQFNSVADPRVIQFKDMSNDEKIHLKSSMTPQERSEFGAKLAKARQLGIAQ